MPFWMMGDCSAGVFPISSMARTDCSRGLAFLSDDSWWFSVATSLSPVCCQMGRLPSLRHCRHASHFCCQYSTYLTRRPSPKGDEAGQSTLVSNYSIRLFQFYLARLSVSRGKERQFSKPLTTRATMAERKVRTRKAGAQTYRLLLRNLSSM